MASKRAAGATVLLAGVGLTGCQLVFGLGDYVEGVGGAGGAPTSTSTGGGSTSSGGGGSAPGCVDVGEAWTPVSLVSRGAGDTPPLDACPDGASSPLNLYAGAPSEAECAACTCAASGCAPPAFSCFTDEACTAGEKSFTGLGSDCVDLGMTARSCKLAAAPTASCTAGGGGVATAPSFAERWSFCPDARCGREGEVHDEVACVAAASATLPCPEGFEARLELAGGLEVACPACSCQGSCGSAAYRSRDSYLGVCGALETAFGSTSCTDVTIATFGVTHAGRRSGFGASCAPSPAGPQAGAVSTVEPNVVCCRAPLDPSGAGGAGGGGGAGGASR